MSRNWKTANPTTGHLSLPSDNHKNSADKPASQPSGQAARRHGRPRYRAFAISLALSVAIFVGGLLLVGDLSAARIIHRLLFPLARLMGFIAIGLLAGQAIEVLGWTHALSVVARPFFRFGNLGERCSAAFTAAFVSGVSANAMLLDFYKDGKITKQQLFLTNFVNQLPAYFLHLPTTFFIILPLTRTAGLLYYLLTFAAVLLRTVLLLLYGRLFVRPPAAPADMAASQPAQRKSQKLLTAIREKLPTRVMNVAVFVLPIYIAVFFVNELGLFKLANQVVAQTVTVSFMPVESLSIVIFSFAAEFTSGFAAAGALMTAGLLTVKQTVLALLIGNILAFPIRALRHQLPRYMGIFSPKMGAQILLTGQLLRVLSLIIVGIVYYFAG